LFFYRGVLWVLQGARAAEAEQPLQNYISNVTPRTGYPSHAQARLWLARFYEKQKHCDAAEAQYREVLVTDPKNERALAGYKRVRQGCK
jgi:Tfp pilus assembly protein PilF